MKYQELTKKLNILIIALFLNVGYLPAQSGKKIAEINFYGDTLPIELSQLFDVSLSPNFSMEAVEQFYRLMDQAGFEPVINKILEFRKDRELDDWLYYQLIRSTAEVLSPKAANYQRYTLFKWFLLIRSGYDATISTCGEKLLLYIQSDEEIFEVPYHTKNGKQYVCLNYHDYGSIDFAKEKFTEVNLPHQGLQHSFTYKVTRLPDFKTENYSVKKILFDYDQREYQFNILVNDQVKKIFSNYPVVDYSYYFNIPISKTTYGSLIPLLKENVRKMNQANGVDYLMRFTRYAFVFQTDTKNFGAEKRLSPEQTLLYEYSDCEDRAAFFFYLVKEIYNLPMIVLSYPGHITIAVKFSKPVGQPIYYKGNEYSICEATPQKQDLLIGKSIPKLKKVPFDVVYEYDPATAVNSSH